jgi:hypothetical protein
MEQRLGLESVQPAIHQAGQERVARTDRVDRLDLGRDYSVSPAAIQEGGLAECR